MSHIGRHSIARSSARKRITRKIRNGKKKTMRRGRIRRHHSRNKRGGEKEINIPLDIFDNEVFDNEEFQNVFNYKLNDTYNLRFVKYVNKDDFKDFKVIKTLQHNTKGISDSSKTIRRTSVPIKTMILNPLKPKKISHSFSDVLQLTFNNDVVEEIVISPEVANDLLSRLYRYNHPQEPFHVGR